MRLVYSIYLVAALWTVSIVAAELNNNNNKHHINVNNNNIKNNPQHQLKRSRRDLPPDYSPVVFIPGDGGSQLEAKLNKTERVHHICSLVSDWYDLWLNIHLLVPPAIDCLLDDMRLTYNATSRTSQNSPGVQIRPTNFGTLDSVAYLDVIRLPKTNYFERIIQALEEKNNLTRNIDMVAAPYDFRKAPNELSVFFKNLTELIQDTYIKNNYRPVTLICHSMGCLNSLYLLNRQSKSWKDIFVRRLITLAAPWAGSIKAVSAMLHGDNLGIPLLSKVKLQALQATFPSLMYLFPRELAFERNRVIVSTPERNFTLDNLDDLFEATNLLDQREMWHDTRDIVNNLTAPDVELWCIYGSGIPTPSEIIFDSSFDSKSYKELEEDGDGTVNLESLRACEKFAQQQEKPVYTRNLENVDHIDILRGEEAADYVSYIVDSHNRQLIFA